MTLEGILWSFSWSTRATIEVTSLPLNQALCSLTHELIFRLEFEQFRHTNYTVAQQTVQVAFSLHDSSNCISASARYLLSLCLSFSFFRMRVVCYCFYKRGKSEVLFVVRKREFFQEVLLPLDPHFICFRSLTESASSFTLSLSRCF